MVNVSEDLFGMDSRLLKLNSYVGTSLDDVCMIGMNLWDGWHRQDNYCQSIL